MTDFKDADSIVRKFVKWIKLDLNHFLIQFVQIQKKKFEEILNIVLQDWRVSGTGKCHLYFKVLIF